MGTVEVLRAARKLIEDERNWRQGYGEAGRSTCAIGAVHLAVGYSVPQGPISDEPHIPAADDAGLALCRAMSGREPSSRSVIWTVGEFEVTLFNDVHSHAEVLAAFDRAIANEEAKAQEFTVTPSPVAV